jgi:hypothetical protein
VLTTAGAVHAELTVDPSRLAQFNPPTFRQRLHRIRGCSWARLSIRVLSRFVERQQCAQALAIGFAQRVVAVGVSADSSNAVYGRFTIWGLRQRLSTFVQAYVSSRGVGSLAECDAVDDDPEFTYGITDLYFEQEGYRYGQQ